jgi:hypothetical protein
MFPRPSRSSTRSRSADQLGLFIAFVLSRGRATDVSQLTRPHTAHPRGVIHEEVGSKRGAKIIDTTSWGTPELTHTRNRSPARITFQSTYGNRPTRQNLDYFFDRGQRENGGMGRNSTITAEQRLRRVTYQRLFPCLDPPLCTRSLSLIVEARLIATAPPRSAARTRIS